MKSYLIGFALFAAAAAAQAPTAEQVLEKARNAYASLKAVHMVIEREETSYIEGRPFTALSECELAATQGNRYYARFKLPNVEAMVVSDGSNIWRALVTKKQWTKMTAASIEDPNAEEQGGGSAPHDLHGMLQNIMLYHFMTLAKIAQGPAIVKEEDYKIGHNKAHGYLVRGHTDQITAFELLIDQSSFLVLRAKEQRKAPEGEMDIVTKVKRLEINQDPDQALFTFTPQKGWSEAEMLVLPGEQRMLLTGERAGNFRLKTLDGQAVALDSLRGKVVVLDFWATWCPPCREELPSVEKLHKEFGDAVAFYGVNDEESPAVKRFVTQNKYEMPVLMDSQRDVHRQYGVQAIPTVLIIGADGVIRQHYIGGRDEGVLRKAIQEALKHNG